MAAREVGAVRRLLLITDLDRTLLPNGPQAESPCARPLFRALASLQDVELAFVSGRDRALVQQAIANYGLPRPAMVGADVGTSIFDLRGSNWQPASRWQRELAGFWPTDTRERIVESLRALPQLRLQEHTKQGRFKLSYYVPLHMSRAALENAIVERLQSCAANALPVWSIDEPAGVGLLDIVPPSATKLHAVQFIREELDFDETDCVFAGDSGNDLQVLASAIPSVLVANATPAVRDEARDEAARNGNAEALYLARGGVLGMNGHYAAGIIEGVVHFRSDLGPPIQRLYAQING